LIYQQKFSRVFVGILDPNNDVMGKGLLRLQEANVAVALFPNLDTVYGLIEFFRNNPAEA